MIENKELATIKKPNEPLQYSSKEEFEEMILEIARCKRDIIYFAENYYRVINLDKGLHIIKLYDIQKEFLKFLVENNKVICVSGRQQGKCVFKGTQITIKNKKTNKIETLDILDFYSRILQANPDKVLQECLEFIQGKEERAQYAEELV